MNAINFPWYTYPNILTSSYNTFDAYRQETRRLYEYIKNFKCSTPVLFHLTIGAAMEEYLSQHTSIDDSQYGLCKSFQWRQLFPHWIQTYITNNVNAYVEIIIVSPNKCFYMEYKQPIFVRETDHIFNWMKITDRCFISMKYPNLKINIFYTLFPHKCSKNKNMIAQYRSTDKLGEFKPFLRQITQTEYDCLLIDTFYDTFQSMLNKIIHYNGFISCYSFAVFNLNTCYSRICNFEMFREVAKLIQRYPSYKRHVCEWQYRHLCYCMFDILSDSDIVHTYVEPSERMSYGHIPTLEYTDEFIGVTYVKYEPPVVNNVTYTKSNYNGYRFIINYDGTGTLYGCLAKLLKLKSEFKIRKNIYEEILLKITLDDNNPAELYYVDPKYSSKLKKRTNDNMTDTEEKIYYGCNNDIELLTAASIYHLTIIIYDIDNDAYIPYENNQSNSEVVFIAFQYPCFYLLQKS